MKIFNKIHFGILILIILNTISYYLSYWELKYEIAYALNIALYLSGIISFIKNTKSFKFKTIYFSIYPISIISFGLFYLFGGILFALIGGTLIKPLYPVFSEYSKDRIELYPEYNGFLSRCCSYKVNKNYGIFEKKIGTILLDTDSKPPNSEIKLINEDIIEITYIDYQNIKQTEFKKLEK